MQRTDHVPEAGRSGGSGEPRGTGSFDLGTGYDRGSTDPEAAREAGDTVATSPGSGASPETQPAAVPAPREPDDPDLDADRGEDSRADAALPGETSTWPPSTGETSTDQASSDEARSDDVRSDEVLAGRDTTEQDRTELDEAEADEAERDEAGLATAERDNTDEEKASQDKAALDEAERERAGVHRAPGGDDSRLFTGDQSTDFRDRWREVQAGFVDDPVASLAAAEALLSEVTAALTSAVGARGATTDTEVLRTRLRSYRGVVERLLDS